jgi:glycerophosphoryl diester phosphodiesterase
MMPPPEPLSTAALLRAAGRDFRRAWLPLAVYAVALRLLAGFVVVPAAAWVLARVVAASGHTAVSNTDILTFLLTPTGLATAALVGSAALSGALLEHTGVLAVAALVLSGRPVSVRQEAMAVVGGVVRVLRLGAVQLGLLALVAAPFVALAGLTYFALLSRNDINYYLADRPPAFYTAALVAGVLALAAGVIGAWLYVRWSLALPILLFERTGARPALRESAARVRGAGGRIGVTLFGWYLLSAAGGVIVLAGFGWLAGALLRAGGERLGVVIPLTAGLLVVHALLTAGYSYLVSAGHGLLVLRWYVARGGPAHLHGPGAPAMLVPPASRKWLVRLAGLGGAAFAAAVLWFCLGLAQPLGLEDRIEVTAHRGYAHAAPENTLSAFRKAIEARADYAELDVQLTADGTIIILHDRDFARVARVPKRPGQMTLAEVKELDVGSTFSPAFAGERVPTLKEVIDLARGRIKLNVELKVYGGDRRIAAATADLLRTEAFEDQCIVTSLDHEGVQLARRHNPRLRTALIVTYAVGDLSRLDVDALSVNAGLATDDLLRAAQKHGKEVMVWTVDDPREATRLIERGVRNLITNDPALLAGLRDERANLTDVERLLLAGRHVIGAGD